MWNQARMVVMLMCLSIMAVVQTEGQAHDTEFPAGRNPWTNTNDGTSDGLVTSREQLGENASTTVPQELTNTKQGTVSTRIPTVIPETAAGTTSVCPDGWTERTETRVCYFVSTDKAMWLKARDACSAIKSSLVSIHSDSENRFIHSILNRTLDYWIGMTADSFKDNKWYDGSDVTWTKWSDMPAQYYGWCASLFSSSPFPDEGWGTTVCYLSNPYVCKKELHFGGGDEVNATYSWLLIGGIAGGAILFIVVVVAAKTNAVQVAKRQFQSAPPQRTARISRSEMPLPPIPVRPPLPNIRAMSLPPIHDNPPLTTMSAHGHVRRAESCDHRIQHSLNDTSFTSEDGYEIPRPRSLPQDDYSNTYLEILPSISDECVGPRNVENNEDNTAKTVP